jgi:hypothetical protein
VPPGTDAAEVIRIVTAQVYYRLITAGEPLSREVADRAAAAVPAGTRELDARSIARPYDLTNRSNAPYSSGASFRLAEWYSTAAVPAAG